MHYYIYQEEVAITGPTGGWVAGASGVPTGWVYIFASAEMCDVALLVRVADYVTSGIATF